MARKPPPTPEDHRKRPLEPPENAEVRDVLDRHRYWRWFRDISKSFFVSVTIVGAGLVVLRDWVSAALAWLFNVGGQ